MQSLRSRLFLFLLEHRHWLRLRWQREVVDFETSIEDLRQGVEQPASPPRRDERASR